MDPVKVFREGKGTFTEWHFENGRPLGRILNRGAGVFLENTFSFIDEARSFCERELEKDPSLILYVVEGGDIIDAIQDDAYQLEKENKENRIYAVMSIAVVMLLASCVSFMFMPFQIMIHDVLFIGGMGALYLLLYSTGGRWHLEGVVAIILLLTLLSAVVPLLTK